ncbi:MAG: hypothetical protein A2167_04070 [Planctomycetes bacterium RBG_13_46_10]|nr:MAG: hypothetical protein A2167_04070 [Planctomycetes bacterium RBG_13_46_10]
MKTYFDCIPCFIRQVLDSVRITTTREEIHEKVLREALCLASEMDLQQSPPVMAQKIHRLIRQITSVKDPYREVKGRFNDVALKLYPKMRQTIINSDDPLNTAVRLAIAGNIIDFGVNSSLQETYLEETIHQCLSEKFDDMQLEPFRNAANNAENILYIADNAGEIVFDRLLIEQLPIEKIIVVVKGFPVINDATMEDAILAGLPKIVEVIDNGSDAPGTILESCCGYFQDRFEKADLIISKGQGNYETLSDINKNIFFILKAKCSVIARDIGCKVGEMIFQKSKAFNGEREDARV